jgi:O-antigen/teichoic acid export membrane protein
MPGTARKLASGFFFRFANTIATAVVSVLVMPFVVHSLGDRDYGIWTLVATFVGYYGVLELGLAAAVSRYLARSLGAGDEEDCNRVFNTSLRLYLGIGGAALLLSGLVAASAHWVCRNPADAALFWKLILILGTSIALMFPTRVFKGLLEAHLRFDIAACLELTSLVLRTGLIFPAIFMGYGVVGLAWVTVLASLPAMLLQVYYAHRELPFLRLDGRYWQRDTARSLFSYSVYSLIANLANILCFRVDGIVVAAYVGLAAVTHYRVGGVLTQYFFDLMSAVFGVFLSVFSRLDGAEDYEALKRTFFFASKCAICVSSFIGFSMLAWGKPFIVRWMGPQYVDSYRVMVLLVIGVTVSLWQGPSVSLLYAISKHKFYAIFSSVEAVANLVLSLIFVHWYGIYGVALGTLVPMFISKIVVQPVYVCRVAGIDYFDYVRRSGRTLAFVAMSLLIPTLLSIKFAAPNYKVLFLLGIVSAVLYGVPLWLLELSGPEAQILRTAFWTKVGTKEEMSHAAAD